MSDPARDVIARTGRGTAPADPPGRPAEWAELSDLLSAGAATTWLSVAARGGVHTRPVFAAWTGEAFVVASNPNAVKTRYLERAERCSLALGLDGVHLVVEAAPRRMTSSDELAAAVHCFRAVFDWPTTVNGTLLDAPYAAPTSGGPPFQVYELSPTRAHAFPTDDSFEPTRFRFGK